MQTPITKRIGSCWATGQILLGAVVWSACSQTDAQPAAPVSSAGAPNTSASFGGQGGAAGSQSGAGSSGTSPQAGASVGGTAAQGNTAGSPASAATGGSADANASGAAPVGGEMAVAGAEQAGASQAGTSAGGEPSVNGGADAGGAASSSGGAAEQPSGGSANAGAAGSADSALLDPSLLESCTGTSPVSCHIDAPNGNYNVTVELGAEAEAATTRVQSELYRISVPETATRAGEFALFSFSVNVRTEQHDGYSAPGGVLDLLFDGALPRLHGLGVAPAPDAITIFVASDSTVCDWDPTAANISSENQRGWAQAFTQYLKPGAAMANYADSGETAGSFYTKFWAPARSLLQQGDYVFIQFGHNDQKNQSDIDNYQSNLMRYVDDARSVGATPVLFTPVNRKGTTANFEGLDQQARDLAQAEDLALIDLTNLSIEYYRGQSDLNSLFAEGDGTHLSELGATVVSGLVAQAISESDLPLRDYIR